ncbi:MAG: tetratricopeptide repeat protein [Pirellulales bacterium]
MPLWFLIVASIVQQAAEAPEVANDSSLVTIQEVPLIEQDKEIALLPAGARMLRYEVRGDKTRVLYGKRLVGWIASDRALGVHEGIRRYTDRINGDANDAQAYVIRAACWDAEGKVDKQLADLDAAIRLQPKNGSYVARRGLVRVAQGEHGRALQDFDRAIELGFKEAEVYQARGKVWSDRKVHERALRDYTEAIRIDPKEPWSFFYRAKTWDDTGDQEKALKDLADAIRNDPAEYAFYDYRARIWLSRKRPDKAIEEFTAAIAANPNHYRFRLRRALLRVNHGDHDGAISDYSVAIRLAPLFPTGYLGRGAAYFAKGDPKNAIRDFDAALERCDDDRISEIYRRRAKAHMGLFEDEKAATDFSEAIKRNPRDDDALLGRACALVRLGRYGLAVSDLNNTIELKPKNEFAHMMLAMIFASCPDDTARDGQKAVASAKRACELTEWKSPLRVQWLACAHAEAGEFDEAVRRIEQAIELADEARQAGLGELLELFRARKPFRFDPDDFRQEKPATSE